MSDRKENIRKLIEMQNRFIERDHEHGVSMRECFAPAEDSPLKGYREDYTKTAHELIDQAHELKGSKR